MNDQNQFGDPEEIISCPYEIAHTCPRKRLAFHLIKCRKQHPELARELRQCIHNCQHKIPRPEYEYHLETCPDRGNYYQSQYQVGEVENEALPALLNNLKIPINIVSEENWDDVPPVDVLANIRRDAQHKNVLENFSNEPKAVRRTLREANRQKHRELLNEEERRERERNQLNQASTSRSHRSSRDGASSSSPRYYDDDNSSGGSPVSARSEVSASGTDVSYQTALTSSMSRMNEFKKVERKKRIGRGSGQVSSYTSNIQHGIGRGRKRDCA